MLSLKKTTAAVAVLAAIFSLVGLVEMLPMANAAGTSPALTGTLTAVGDGKVSIQPGSGQPIAITISDATVVKVNGQVAKAADLKVGMKAAIIGQHLSVGQAATEIRAYTPQPPASQPAATQVGFSGVITALGDGKVTIQPKSGQAFAITIDDKTVVKVNGQVATAADLKVGMNAGVIGQHLSHGQAATEIRAYTPQPPVTQPAPTTPAALTGTLTAVGEGKVSIQSSSGQPIAITVNDATVVKIGGQVAKAADLKVGMRAAVFGQHLSLGQAATEIRAYTPTK